jgi:hypothetical protein
MGLWLLLLLPIVVIAAGRRLLTDQGRDIGSLQEIDIDGDGAVIALTTSTGQTPTDAFIGIVPALWW